MRKDGILSGIKVIDCGTYIAGPASTTVMSDFGAEVFKIERPDGGDLWRLFPHLPGTPKSELNYAWVLTGRNKKSVALDLGSPEGYEALVRLVRELGQPTVSSLQKGRWVESTGTCDVR